MNQDRNDDERKPQGFNPGRTPLPWILILVAVGAMLWFSQPMIGRSTSELSYTELVEKIKNKEIKSIKIERHTGEIRGTFAAVPGEDAPRHFTSSVDPEALGTHLVPLLDKESKYINVSFPPQSWVKDVIPVLLPMLFLAALFYFFVFRQMRGGSGGILSFGKSRAVRFNRDKNRKSFDDVAGIDEAREEVKEIIEFLRNPEKFQAIGGRLPRGVLLVGQPGSGKTLLAKAIAGEADVPFFSISGSDFVEMFVGVGASRVRDLFEQAKTNAPCIIFLDEIDAVGRKRAHDIPGSGVETSQTLNAILVEMDGFTSDESVIVMAATNRPDVLDPALLRPGRFDRRINVDLPDIKGREAILKVHTKGVKLAEDVDLTVVARGTPMFSGAELENLVNESALIAVMQGKKAVDMPCMEEARDKVRFGKEKRSRVMDEEEKRATAYHEAGHAVLRLLLEDVEPLHKVTIIPRGMYLGATMHLPEKDEYHRGRKRLTGDLITIYGGRAAEEIFLDDVTTGAASDIETATRMVRSMICEWGMSETLGLVRYSEPSDRERGFFEGREFSESSAQKIDDEVHRITGECYDKARRMLEEHREDVELLVTALMEFEVLGREEVETLMRERSLDSLRLTRRHAESEAADEEKDEEEEAVEAKPTPPETPPASGLPSPLPGA